MYQIKISKFVYDSFVCACRAIDRDPVTALNAVCMYYYLYDETEHFISVCDDYDETLVLTVSDLVYNILKISSSAYTEDLEDIMLSFDRLLDGDVPLEMRKLLNIFSPFCGVCL